MEIEKPTQNMGVSDPTMEWKVYTLPVLSSNKSYLLHYG